MVTGFLECVEAGRVNEALHAGDSARVRFGLWLFLFLILLFSSFFHPLCCLGRRADLSLFNFFAVKWQAKHKESKELCFFEMSGYLLYGERLKMFEISGMMRHDRAHQCSVALIIVQLDSPLSVK